MRQLWLFAVFACVACGEGMISGGEGGGSAATGGGGSATGGGAGTGGGFAVDCPSGTFDVWDGGMNGHPGMNPGMACRAWARSR